VAGH